MMSRALRGRRSSYFVRNLSPTDDSANAEEDGEGEVPYEASEGEVPYETPTEPGDNEGTRHYIIPDADAVIDPKRPEDDGVFKEICGAVVAWKFMWCLYKKFGKIDEFNNSDFLEIASLGTVCDVMELQHDNRAIVKEGLKKMQNPGPSSSATP